ncbi:selenocysteine-specific translation elongation factor [Halalkalibacter nanhaiisediminis]|uniref:Selenocysteine-specific elongation factor n=1 Tax=Halalkalibacter nanhaiisediminis TaxID=688079 RepID=A0A562QRA9_9BACI|nr:selenocysteine-specific translation elongation factor [Halalkalibacter nanhaiisediminis]TWI59292.1 selenocysteine-specific translation elongation factor SelB [Halalkalibacter nanhaiisediminis]
MNHYTVGMAGHIDHGKTTLTKALTNIDTDRLKEEQERQISIELGYAPLKLNDEMEVSLIDVPGHERFIRQMIAGVAGIDLVMLVVAADEGVMPQTREHIDILRLLGIEQGIIVVTKMDRVDEEMHELVELDIRETVEGTFLEDAKVFFVDSKSGVGIDQLKTELAHELAGLSSRDASGAFRLPIDQVFTVHGQGTVVRGTVYEGVVKEGDVLEILPQKKSVRARQLQVHHEPRQNGRAGQRVAVNLGGIGKDEIKRGDVLAASGHYEATDTIDVSLHTVAELRYSIKQRSAIKLHIGTAEVYGKIVFFDRNELTEGNEEMVCQLRLDEPIVTRRGDRFILRRPTPMETIGGGTVIDAHGQKYRFGEETVRTLEQKKAATPEEQFQQLILEKKLLTIKEASNSVHLSEEQLAKWMDEQAQFIILPTGEITSEKVIQSLRESIEAELAHYHLEYPLRQGIKKAELVQSYLQTYPKKILEWMIEEGGDKQWLTLEGPYVALGSHSPHPPEKWAKRVEHVMKAIQEEDLQVSPVFEHIQKQQIPQDLFEELIHYFHQQEILFQIDDKLSIHAEPFKQAIREMKEKTNESFSLQEAKEVTGLSRKYLVPFLEKIDKLGLTIRQEQERRWTDDYEQEWLYKR